MFDTPTEYCEQLLQTGWEPVNTISNLAFVIAGVLALYALRNQKGLLKFLLPLLLALIGIGSSWWHITHTYYGGVADIFSIFIFASGVIILFLRKLLQSWAAVLTSFLVLLTLTLSVEQLNYLNGSVPYLILLGGFVLGSIFYARKFNDSRSLVKAAALTFGFAILFRSIDISICSAIYVGTHFLWHILVATFGYQLIMLVAKKVI